MQSGDRVLPFVKAIRIAALATVLATAACAGVQETIDEASARLDRLFDVETHGAAPSSEAAERLYRDGRASAAPSRRSSRVCSTPPSAAPRRPQVPPDLLFRS